MEYAVSGIQTRRSVNIDEQKDDGKPLKIRWRGLTGELSEMFKHSRFMVS